MDYKAMGGIALVFVFVGVILAVNGMVLEDVQDTATADYGATSAATNVTVEGLDGLSTLASWLPLIGLVMAAAVIISTLGFFGTR